MEGMNERKKREGGHINSINTNYYNSHNIGEEEEEEGGARERARI